MPKVALEDVSPGTDQTFLAGETVTSDVPSFTGWTPRVVAGKAVRGALALSLRQVCVHGANITGGIVLARLLTPSDFGLYSIALFMLTFSVTFGGTGLAANLIRQQLEPDDAEYKSVFAAQQALVGIIVFLMWVLSPMITSLYHLQGNERWLFRCVALSLMFTSLMVIPQVQMERSLLFGKLAMIEATQAVLFNLTAVVLAWKGYGPFSFAVALVLRSVAGAGLAYVLNPWPMAWSWDWGLVKRHLSFGSYYQGGEILNLLKNMISPLFIGIAIGTAAVGYINWTSNFVNYPVTALMLLSRLYLPAFSKLAHTPEKMKHALETVISLLSVCVFAMSGLMFVFRYPLTIRIFGDKWLIAMPLFLPMMLINFLLAPAVVGVSALNALGYSKFIFRIMVLWTVSTWIAGPVFISLYGWRAWGWINLLVHCSSILVLIKLRSLLHIEWVAVLGRPLLVALVSSIFARLALMAEMAWIPALTCSFLVAVILAWLFLNREIVRMRRAFMFSFAS